MQIQKDRQTDCFVTIEFLNFMLRLFSYTKGLCAHLKTGIKSRHYKYHYHYHYHELIIILFYRRGGPSRAMKTSVNPTV